MSKYVNGNQVPTTYTWLTPNMCNCGHDCPVTTVSPWLQNTLKLNTIFSKPWFTDGSTLVILVCDDGGSASTATLCLMMSTSSKGIKSNVSYKHINVLSTVMWLLGITGSIGSSSASIAMKDLFGSTPPPTSVLTSIAVSPASVSVNIGSTTQLIAVCKDQNNSTMTCPSLTWTSTDITKATVDSKGIVTGISTGTVSITAISGTITSNKSAITVTQSSVLKSITISPVTISLNIGETTQLTSTCKDTNGSTITCPSLVWTSSDITKATVNSTGNITGITTGTTNVTATNGSIVSNTSTVTVNQTPPPTNKIVVTNPTAGLIWKIGSTNVIKWTHTNASANVHIELLKTGKLVKTISAKTPNDNSFSWKVPSVTSGIDYQIKVTSNSNSLYFGVSGNFTIS